MTNTASNTLAAIVAILLTAVTFQQAVSLPTQPAPVLAVELA